MTLSRSRFLHLAGATLVASPAFAQTSPPQTSQRMNTRKIPATGELLPVVGVGTWQTFDVGAAPAERAPRAEVLKVLFEAGGSVIDSSPMYGRAEAVVGDLLADSGTRAKAFLATKVWTHGREQGIAQMEQSMKRLRTDKIDLMQIHNVVDWETHLPTLKAWKAEGRIRLMGITHYTESMQDTLEAILQLGSFDFVQVNYALDDRGAERRLLDFARHNHVAVMVNQPFGGGGLLKKLSGRPLPAWAKDIGCTSWAQILLKFVLAHPAVTCVIPGTSNPAHMRDNVQAGFGPYPDRNLIDRMTDEIAI
jgi:aryl-alcohol dehydrogenase-like predicted oxidoreductase